jgi:hypothetical protein
MGHKSLETTMGYTHAEALSVCSPLDALPVILRPWKGDPFLRWLATRLPRKPKCRAGTQFHIPICLHPMWHPQCASRLHKNLVTRRTSQERGDQLQCPDRFLEGRFSIHRERGRRSGVSLCRGIRGESRGLYHRSFLNSSTPMPTCRRMARKVPVSISGGSAPPSVQRADPDA